VEDLRKLRNIRKITNGSKRKLKSKPSPKRNKGPTKPSNITGYEKSLGDYPPELRGPPQNRYGGHNTVHMRVFKDNTFGAAGPCRTYSAKERAHVEQELRAKGLL
jgi:hypothetical protein